MNLTGLLVIGIIILPLFLYTIPFRACIKVKSSGVDIPLIKLYSMRIRNLSYRGTYKIPINKIVSCIIEAQKTGLKEITYDKLESHYFAGGDIERLVQALILASNNKFDLSFNYAAIIDLAGYNVLKAAREKKDPFLMINK